MRNHVAICVFLLILQKCTSSNILAVLPTAAKSHYIVGSSLMKGLAQAGHKVTVLSLFSLPESMENYEELLMDSSSANNLDEHISMFYKSSQSIFAKLGRLSAVGLQITNKTIHDEAFRGLLSSGRQFDVVIVEIFMAHALIGLGQHFNAPVICLSTFGDTIWTTQLVGSPSPTSFVPNPQLEFSHKMNFKERLQNGLISFAELMILKYYSNPKQVNSICTLQVRSHCNTKKLF